MEIDKDKQGEGQSGAQQSGPTGPTPEEVKNQQLKADNEKLEKDKLAKQEHLSNITKAIDEAEQELKKTRDAKKGTPPPKEGEEEIPQIDMNDPGSKAWKKEINDSVSPVQKDLDKGKTEVRTFALREFLADKPSLAASPEKVKELMNIYDRIKVASETTKEGVLLDLGKAFGALFHDELISAARTNKVNDARQQQLFVDPVIDKGTTNYPTEQDRMPQLSEQDRQQLAGS